ncbi:MAG TPA: anti-sigma regulatory factor [Candidatus Sericytochromatia bacterium]
MIAISLRPVGRDWGTISFASTLFLCPILDLLLAQIPSKLQAEIRLGLQEALVNAAKHGNQLDPSKTVVVHFSVVDGNYWWVISDEGCGFSPPYKCHAELAEELPEEKSENGRGLCILHQVFDQVQWNSQGTELRLCKQVKHSFLRQALLR